MTGRHSRHLRSPLGQPCPVSLEVLRHHGAQHPCQDAGMFHAVCTCGVTLAVMCGRCAQPVFVVTAPGTWCQHAEAAVA